MRRYISPKKKNTVRNRADCCCEYCKIPDSHRSGSFNIDHIIPIVLDGSSELENLAYSCRGCNECKADKTIGTDPATGQQISLFNPRKDNWNDHFKWDEEALRIIGITLKGELTIQALNMNREGLINLRQLLKNAGLHPPE